MDAPLNNCSHKELQHWITSAEGGGLGFLCLSGNNAQLWMRKMSCDGVAGWVLGRTIELNKLLSLNSKHFPFGILGYAEDDNMFFVRTGIDVTMVQLGSSQFKKLLRFQNIGIYHPFASVYTAGI
ncbi:unnamed protein product [Urochloa humidicola]